MFAQHGLTIRNHDDVQLMSYALDAGRNAHGLETLSDLWLGHAMLTHGELTGSGKNKLSFAQVAIWASVLAWSFWALAHLFSKSFAFGDRTLFLWVGAGDLLAVVAIALLIIGIRQARRHRA